MAGEIKRVNSVADLIAAVNDKDVREIAVATDLNDLPSIELLPGQTLRSASEGRPTLIFRENTDGLRLSSHNTVAGINLVTSPAKRAIWNNYSVDGLGTIGLRSLRTTGRVQILAREEIRSGRIEVDGLEICSADTRAERERPQDYGVSVLQGAFTLWNMQPDENVVLTADLVNLSVGSFGSPVLGSGVFVSGAGDKGGRLNVQRLETNAKPRIIYYIEDHERGAFELGAPTTDVLDVTGQPPEDFETITRRYAALPGNKRTLGHWLREFAQFMIAPLSPGFNLDRYDRELRRPVPGRTAVRT